MTIARQIQTAPARIVLNGDELVRDDIFHIEVLAGANRRTGKRYERDVHSGTEVQATPRGPRVAGEQNSAP
jgi:hypothetical protein